MDPFFIKFDPTGPGWFLFLVSVLALVANAALWFGIAVLIAYGFRLGLGL